MSKTAVGLFPDSEVAQKVVHDLNVSSFPSNEVRVLREPLDMPVSDSMSTPHTDFQVSLQRELLAVGATAAEAGAFVQGVKRGGVLVFATGSSEEVNSANDIMNRNGAIVVDDLAGQEPNMSAMAAKAPDVTYSNSSQTGRTRQSGGGARMFVW